MIAKYSITKYSITKYSIMKYSVTKYSISKYIFKFEVFDFEVFQNTEPKILFLFIGSENSLDSTPTLATPHDLSTPTAGKEVASSS